MGDEPVLADRKDLVDVFSETSLKFISEAVLKTRKVSPEDKVSYEDIEREENGVVYIVKAEHVPIDDLVGHALSGCKNCHGKGYYICNLDKAKIPNPQDYVILAEKNIVDMPEAEKKLWLEVEKKKKLWRIMLPCRCALKAITKKQPGIFTNEPGNIVARLSCVVK
jgi:hypothetical protein